MNTLYIILAATAIIGTGFVSIVATVFVLGLFVADTVADKMSQSY